MYAVTLWLHVHIRTAVHYISYIFLYHKSIIYSFIFLLFSCSTKSTESGGGGGGGGVGIVGRAGDSEARLWDG